MIIDTADVVCTFKPILVCLVKRHISVMILCFRMFCCKFISLERAVGDGERMFDLLQRWGQHRSEVRFFLRHNRAPSRELGKCFFTPATQSHTTL